MENQTRSPAKSKPKSQSKSTYRINDQYLVIYNAICLALWTTILLRTLSLIPILLTHSRLYQLYDALFTLLKWTQTLALLEIVHATIGLVRASPITTAMQVASRIAVVWIVLDRYPDIVSTTNTFGRPRPGDGGGQYAFAGILVAWGVTEVIRYGFFVYKEGISQRLPEWLTWLRYNTFFVLYPLGISSECWLVYSALGPSKKEGMGLDWFFKVVLGIYVPGSYVLYTHMMRQRRKVLKGKGKVG